ncbi:MAG: hypothetical protein KJZ78_10350 [Bryobacteraceae bacterium]|nr:hypothetical protein [Bryobacteraceae bacterium]
MPIVLARTATALVAAAAGWFASMAVLRMFHEWAFSTEFDWWLHWSGLHAVLVWLVLAGWFHAEPPAFTGARAIGKMLAASVTATILAAVLGVPGLVLIVTGQAFITSAVATFAYGCILSAVPAEHGGTGE